MKDIKKEIKTLYTFIILFIVCSFLLIMTIILLLSNNTNKSKNFDKVINSVVSIHSYTNGIVTKIGSGFIYKVNNDKAYILTNNHVVENIESVKVYISETEKVNGSILGYNKYLDVAVISIKNDNYKPLKLNKNNNYKIGDQVYTIGTPISLEFFNSTASGIISKPSKFRYEENSKEQVLMNMIQTDIITNPGNSGGPLFNENLEVIGITTSNIETTTVTNISYAVPISQIINKLDELENKGEVKLPKIGKVEIVDLNDSEKLYNNNLISMSKETKGVIALNDDNETSLKKGDIIIKINDFEIKDIDYYNYYLNQLNKNDKVKLTIIRNNKQKTLNIKIK